MRRLDRRTHQSIPKNPPSFASPPASVLPILLPRKTRSKWVYLVHYRPAFTFSIFSRLRPLGLPYGWLAWKPPGGISAAFPCSVVTTGRVRSTLYTGGATFASGYVRQPEPDRWPYLGLSLKPPRMARSFDDACECSISLTVPSNSSAAPGLRLPGWLHCREGFTPWTVALRQPVQRALPWNTCRERQS
jgi:hypothetical protein